MPDQGKYLGNLLKIKLLWIDQKDAPNTVQKVFRIYYPEFDTVKDQELKTKAMYPSLNKTPNHKEGSKVKFRPFSNSSGVAIIIVMGAITIMTLLLASFSYFISVNKIRIYSNQDKRQARLTTEAGLNTAMAQLEIFKEAFNLYQKNKSVQSTIPFNLLESALTQPFAYPIPVNKESLNLIQKTAIKDFEESTKLKGNLLMSISPITGFINPNSLMITVPKADSQTFQREMNKTQVKNHYMN